MRSTKKTTNKIELKDIQSAKSKLNSISLEPTPIREENEIIFDYISAIKNVIRLESSHGQVKIEQINKIKFKCSLLNVQEKELIFKKYAGEHSVFDISKMEHVFLLLSIICALKECFNKTPVVFDDARLKKLFETGSGEIYQITKSLFPEVFVLKLTKKIKAKPGLNTSATLKMKEVDLVHYYLINHFFNGCPKTIEETDEKIKNLKDEYFLKDELSSVLKFFSLKIDFHERLMKDFLGIVHQVSKSEVCEEKINKFCFTLQSSVQGLIDVGLISRFHYFLSPDEKMMLDFLAKKSPNFLKKIKPNQKMIQLILEKINEDPSKATLKSAIEQLSDIQLIGMLCEPHDAVHDTGSIQLKEMTKAHVPPMARSKLLYYQIQLKLNDPEYSHTEAPLAVQFNRMLETTCPDDDALLEFIQCVVTQPSSSIKAILNFTPQPALEAIDEWKSKIFPYINNILKTLPNKEKDIQEIIAYFNSDGKIAINFESIYFMFLKLKCVFNNRSYAENAELRKVVLAVYFKVLLEICLFYQLDPKQEHSPSVSNNNDTTQFELVPSKKRNSINPFVEKESDPLVHTAHPEHGAPVLQEASTLRKLPTCPSNNSNNNIEKIHDAKKNLRMSGKINFFDPQRIQEIIGDRPNPFSGTLRAEVPSKSVPVGGIQVLPGASSNHLKRNSTFATILEKTAAPGEISKKN